MSANRIRSGNAPGIDCPTEITFDQFITACAHDGCIVRAQGKIEDATKARGRLVRFNRSVLVDVTTADFNADGNPYVIATRVRWNWRAEQYDIVYRPDGTPWTHTLTWTQLDYVTWKASGDPNGTWIKVTKRA